MGPVRWKAPELFIKKVAINNIAADIHSLGMILWEIVSLKIPYSIATDETIAALWISQGKKEIIPAECSPSYADIIDACWSKDPKDRPTAEKIVELLQKANPAKASELSSILLLPKKVVTASSIAFGANKWKEYLGDVGVEPPLPSNIDEILNRPCPFWDDKIVGETHLLVLIPKAVGGKPFTLNLLDKLVQKPKKGKVTKFAHYWDKIKKELGDRDCREFVLGAVY